VVVSQNASARKILDQDGDLLDHTCYFDVPRHVIVGLRMGQCLKSNLDFKVENPQEPVHLLPAIEAKLRT